jgi:hypothetical protein
MNVYRELRNIKGFRKRTMCSWSRLEKFGVVLHLETSITLKQTINFIPLFRHLDFVIISYRFDLQNWRRINCFGLVYFTKPSSTSKPDRARLPRVGDSHPMCVIHSLVTSPSTGGALAAEAHSAAEQTAESRWVHRQLGLPNLTPQSTSSTRSESGRLSPSSPLPPHAPGCHHVSTSRCSSVTQPSSLTLSLPGYSSPTTIRRDKWKKKRVRRLKRKRRKMRARSSKHSQWPHASYPSLSVSLRDLHY